MSVLPGARELGLDVEWRFGFVGHGERAVSTPGVVYVDVGGTPAPGVLDHHDGGAECAADVVVRRPELVYHHLLGPRIARTAYTASIAHRIWRPRIVTHRSPDWDSVVTAHLVMRLVADGELPAYAGALACYARLVDQGRYRVDLADAEEGSVGASIRAAHLGYLALQHASTSDDRTLLLHGIELLTAVLADVQEAASDGPIAGEHAFLPRAVDDPAARWWSNARFTRARESLEQQVARFARDKMRRAAGIGEVTVPAADGGDPIKVPAWIAHEEPESALDKYLVRASGYPFFLCPRGTRRTLAGGKEVFPRVVISLDPEWQQDGRRPFLRGLGFALEQAESAERRRHHGGRDDRVGPPRFPDGSTDNSDPWYDGRAHDWTIVDAPRDGTQLPFDTVVGIATRERYWETPIDAGALHFVWPFAARQGADSAVTVERPTAFVRSLQPLYDEMCESPERESRGLPQLDATAAISIHARRRHFPGGTAPDFKIITLTAGPGATLEALAQAALRVLEQERMSEETDHAAPEPSYRFGRMTVAPHAAERPSIVRALSALGFEHSGDAGRDGAAQVDGRSVLQWCVGPDVHAPDGALDVSAVSPDFEVLLYVAFLNEALGSFSHRIGAAVPEHGRSLESVATRALHQDVLRFQARHYQLEVSHATGLQQRFATLVDATGLSVRFLEVIAELERLSDLERQLADERNARAERAYTSVLYVVAAAGAFQTLVAFATLPAEARVIRSWWASSWWVAFWPTVVVVALALVVAYRRVERMRAHAPGTRVGDDPPGPEPLGA